VSEERYRTAFQMSLDSINLNRLSDGIYVECNNAFLETTGYTREEVIGHGSIELNIWENSADRAGWWRCSTGAGFAATWRRDSGKRTGRCTGG